MAAHMERGSENEIKSNLKNGREPSKAENESSAEEGELNDEEPSNDDNDPEVLEYRAAIQRASPSLRCTCCGDVYSDPVRLPRCGHMMNRDCVAVKRRHGNVLICPMCTQRNYINDTDELSTDFDVAARIPPKPTAWIARMNQVAVAPFHRDASRDGGNHSLPNYNEEGEVVDDEETATSRSSRHRRDKSSRKRKHHRHSRKRHHKRHARKRRMRSSSPSSSSSSGSTSSSSSSNSSSVVSSSVSNHSAAFASPQNYPVAPPPVMPHNYPPPTYRHIHPRYVHPPLRGPPLPIPHHGLPPPAAFSHPPPPFSHPPAGFPLPPPHVVASLAGETSGMMTSLERQQFLRQNNSSSNLGSLHHPAQSSRSGSGLLLPPGDFISVSKPVSMAVPPPSSSAMHFDNLGGFLMPPTTSAPVMDVAEPFMRLPSALPTNGTSHIAVPGPLMVPLSSGSPMDLVSPQAPVASPVLSVRSEHEVPVAKVPISQGTTGLAPTPATTVAEQMAPPNQTEAPASRPNLIPEETFQIWYKSLSSDQSAAYSEAELREMLHDYYFEQQQRAARGESAEDTWREFFLQRYHKKRLQLEQTAAHVNGHAEKKAPSGSAAVDNHGHKATHSRDSGWQHMCIGNLPAHVQARHIYNAVCKYGKVQSIRVVCVNEQGYPYNFAIVSMDSLEAIESSMAALNGTMAFDDNHIIVTRKAAANVFLDR